MAFNAKAVEIIIASPNDVSDERHIVREVLAEWNAIHARDREVILLPLSWETHSSPELSGRPQQMINERVLKHADILVGIFRNRIGSPTGDAISGSIEEIQEHHRKSRPVMLYFSQVPVVADLVDPGQYSKLTVFKNWAMAEGLVWFFTSQEDFRQKFRSHLQLTLRDNKYLKGLYPKVGEPRSDAQPVRERQASTISDSAQRLLSTAAEHDDGLIVVSAPLGGRVIYAGKSSFSERDDQRSFAGWMTAIRELARKELIVDSSGRGETYSITGSGYDHLGATT